MENSAGRNGGDLVLAPGEYAYVLDTTKGLVNTVVGPNKVSMSNTDQPVIFDKAKRRFVRCTVDQAIQVNTIAPEGFYVALYNPAESHPRDGSSQVTVPLTVGHRVNIPGPANFPLWPGQFATVVQGHHLRSNQYLLAQVYNDTEAQSNWANAVVKPQDGTEATTPTPRSFTPGQLLIIKGTDVAFFMPPTGIKVVAEENGNYVREAVTLERLEYCILLDEDGNKRFVRGPDVVFPEPTERFVEKPIDTGGMARKFKAIDLNATTGIYVKVIADYEDETGKHKAGDELFITGKEQAIYFQREEHSIIRYGDQTKHYAVAIPSGEGRYVLDRIHGKVNLVKGPAMLLPDPRTEVIIRRVLAEGTAALWYPNNPRVIEVNRELAALSAQAAPVTVTRGLTAGSLSAANAMTDVSSMNYLSTTSGTASPTSKQIAGDVFSRGQKFQPPRTITLDNKYEGAVSISVWTGYAVLIISKSGQRRVVVGPENVLLEYDETLAPLELSTGRPKNRDKLFRTVYLNVQNNVVSDVIDVETKDLVQAKIAVSYRVNFEGDDKEKWFAVENYVRLLCDHMRSLIRNTVKRKGIEEFYGNPIDIIRDATLGAVPGDGKPRAGRRFDENGMRVYDVEVLDVTISDKGVAQLLGAAQLNSLKSAIQISEEERALDTVRRSNQIQRDTAAVRAETATAVAENTKQEIEANLQVMADQLRQKAEEQRLLDMVNDAEIGRDLARDLADRESQAAKQELELKRLMTETEELVKRSTAISGNLTVALTTFADSALTERIATTLGPLSAMSGVSAVDILSKLFKGTPLAAGLELLGTRTRPGMQTFVAGNE